ncbi:hypothetical protein [Desulforamulus ruminis]|uniref:Uncharacterized protein n=1 Tax=Desulforamulus ruminis (strain ATCC 23193 / DSM 2154 / NCIMB 8452 / DL) TaxID=696281 RepID=F6DSV4_DESRL|nr:hypothetical protein [Desulforamulus ruminis]AEG59948.1 hypothetical protein Desru_1684 [Desulforamulus ruminis DSM 2154]
MYSKDLVFHHIGIPVDKSKLSKQARYSPLFKMYSEEGINALGLHIEFHAFDEGSSLDKRIQTYPHVAFKTENIDIALENQDVIMPLYEPFAGYRCAMILVNEMLIELIETTLPEEKIWKDEKTLKNGVLYGQPNS